MSFSEETIQSIWEKGKVVSGFDANKFRKDECGAWMTRTEYGNQNSKYGWEIDHIKPESEGGGDEMSNLRPLQWNNNRSKQTGRLKCVVTASDKTNVFIK